MTELQKKLDIKGNFINIFFENHFENEKVSMKCDSKEIFSKNITTDNTINLADYYSLAPARIPSCGTYTTNSVFIICDVDI